LIVLANRLPPVRDSTNAWWERVTVLEFPVSIPPEKQVPNIEETWLNDREERSGIINWALEGLKRLLKNKRFTETEALKQKIEEYQRWSQPVQYFINKYCAFDIKLSIPKTNLYDAYKEVCDLEGLPIVTEEVFNREIRRLPRIKEERRRIAGKKVRFWVGIGLKEGALKDLEEGEKEELDQVDQVDRVFLTSGKAQEKMIEEEKEKNDFLSEFKNAGPLGPEVSEDSRRIDINRCGDCAYYRAAKCLLRRDWVTVMPAHPACEWFEPREAAGA